MKGTLFSADFVKDSTGNLRLLELNTDTGASAAWAARLDFSGLINVITSNNINEVHVIYKQFQDNIVEAFSQSITESGAPITFYSHIEEVETIYPTIIEDADNKFILRLAYDESAIFDSTYCRDKEQVLKLFHDNENYNAVPEFYFSSSLETTYDNLRREASSTNMPDLALKNVNNVKGSITFLKVQGTGSVEENFNSFLDKLGEERLAVNYYESIGESNQRSIRSINVIYGPNLETIQLGCFDGGAIFDKPATLKLGEDGVVNTKHYYELTTNYPVFNGENSYGGLFEDEQITDINNTPVSVSTAVVGDKYLSYYVSGSPDTDSIIGFTSWSYPGSQFPSGSYVTSSVLINKVETPLYRNLISHIQTDSSASIRATGNQHILVYDSSSNELRYKPIYEIDIDTDSFLKLDGGLEGVASNDVEVLEGEHSTFLLDFEEVDTYVLHESGLNLKVIAHNACFPAGTEITLLNGDVKNIEDIQPGDEVLSYNIESKELSAGRVSALNVSTQENLVHLTTDSGHDVKCTLGHRIYTTTGWKDAGDINVGDSLLGSEGMEVQVSTKDIIKGEFEVYHIMNVGNDHSYFANGLLVHNYSRAGCFIAGTKITLADGTSKNIEEVEVGEEVLTFNEEAQINATGKVGDLKKHEVNSVVRLTFDNSTVIVTTEKHPFYVVGEGWVPAGQLKELVNCLYTDGSLALLSTVEKLEEKHTVYNLLSVAPNHTFYAHGILVHNKE
jgi:hypothetical protein